MRSGNWTSGMKTLRFLGFVFSFVCVVMLIAYFTHFYGKFAEKSVDWANFGSYFGSITGLMAFLAVLFTAIQSEKRANKAESKAILAESEAKIAAELAKQEADKREARAIEQATRREERDLFFKMLSEYQRQADLITKNKSFSDFTQNDGIKSIIYIIYEDIVSDENFKLSEDADILYIQQEIAQSFGINVHNKAISDDVIAQSLKAEIKKCFETNNFEVPTNLNYKVLGKELFQYLVKIISHKNYNQIYDKFIFDTMRGIGNMIFIQNEDQLGQYFRTIYYILDTISTNIERERYSKIFRSQLSKSELTLLLYNAVSSQSTPKTLKLYKTNDIFNNININGFVMSSLNFNNEYNGNEFINMLYEEYAKRGIE